MILDKLFKKFSEKTEITNACIKDPHLARARQLLRKHTQFRLFMKVKRHQYRLLSQGDFKSNNSSTTLGLKTPSISWEDFLMDRCDNENFKPLVIEYFSYRRKSRNVRSAYLSEFDRLALL